MRWALLYLQITFQVAIAGCPHIPTRHCPKVKCLVEGTVKATQIATLENKPLRAFSRRIPFGKEFLNIKGFDKELVDSLSEDALLKL